jgi:hypothetical protein
VPLQAVHFIPAPTSRAMSKYFSMSDPKYNQPRTVLGLEILLLEENLAHPPSMLQRVGSNTGHLSVGN